MHTFHNTVRLDNRVVVICQFNFNICENRNLNHFCSNFASGDSKISRMVMLRFPSSYSFHDYSMSVELSRNFKIVLVSNRAQQHTGTLETNLGTILSMILLMYLQYGLAIGDSRQLKFFAS